MTEERSIDPPDEEAPALDELPDDVQEGLIEEDDATVDHTPVIDE